MGQNSVGLMKGQSRTFELMQTTQGLGKKETAVLVTTELVISCDQ